MIGYKAVLFARDGAWVTDYKGKTKDEVIEQVINTGSRWFFYPLILMIRDHGAYTSGVQHIVDVSDDPNYQIFKNKRIDTVSEMIKKMSDNEWAHILGDS